MFGRFALAALVLVIVSRRSLLRIFLVPGLIADAAHLRLGRRDEHGTICKYGIFVAGFLTVAQFSFWGNYLPHAFPVHLRGTGESFAANIGGRLDRHQLRRGHAVDRVVAGRQRPDGRAARRSTPRT